MVIRADFNGHVGAGNGVEEVRREELSGTDDC